MGSCFGIAQQDLEARLAKFPTVKEVEEIAKKVVPPGPPGPPGREAIAGFSLIAGGSVDPNGIISSRFGPTDIVVEHTAKTGLFTIKFLTPARSTPFVFVVPSESVEKATSAVLVNNGANRTGFTVHTTPPAGVVGTGTDYGFWFMAIEPTPWAKDPAR
jgi:hypothetical protein